MKIANAFTFPMSRESESASRLKAIISDMLPLFTEDYSDDVLSEYITLLVCNGKSQTQAREDLEAFLGEQSWEFVARLWELLKDFSQDNSASKESKPKTAADFGSHGTLKQQGLSSTLHKDYDERPTNAMMNDNLILATIPIDDIEAHVSPKAESMKMLRQELINSPCIRAQPTKKDDWNLSGVNYSRKILRSIVVSATKQACGMNPDKYDKYAMDEGTGVLQNLPYLQEREMSQSVPSGGAVSARSHDAALCQETKPHVSVWDRLGRPSSSRVHTLPKFGIQADENKALQHHGPAFSAAYSEQYCKTFEREVPAVGYRHAVYKSHKSRQPKSGTITSTEPHTAYNLSRKRRYGIMNPKSVDAPVCEFSSVLQYKKPFQDIEKPSLLSQHSAKPDLFSEILDVKQKLQQLEFRIFQSKQLKKQKVGELKGSPQSGALQYQEDVSESRIIHVTNVHYAASEEAISMLFSKCGAVEKVRIVTDPVTQHPKGAAFVTFATKESIEKAIDLNNTNFYSRPIKVRSHVISDSFKRS